MDISRLKKLFAGTAAVAITLTSTGSVFAAYSDVPEGVWYDEAVSSFLDAGYLDASQPRFRGSDNANRAEFTKLVVELNGGVLSTPPASPSFTDVKPGTWYYSYMEEAGKEGWVKGDKDCYGSQPCYARPGANINRAEAAAIIIRAFGIEATGDAPTFVDVPAGQWYSDIIQAAADHCILQGDDNTGRVRPGDNMNRAEMVTMLHRVDQNLTYGVDCGTDGGGQVSAGITDVSATDATTIEIGFNTPVDAESAGDKANYKITGASTIEVASVKVVDETTVQVTLASAMSPDSEYTLSVQDIATDGGDTFSDSASFTGYSPIVKGDGVLEAAIASTNPVGDSVPKGAVGVVLLSIDMTASCDDSVILEHLTVLHEGFGDASDVDGVYASIDGQRMSRKRSIDSQDQTSDLRFRDPLTIPACGTKTVDIVADFSSTSVTSAEHNFTVELPTDFHSNAKEVKGNFPIRGNTFRLAAVSSGQVTVTYRTVSPDKVQVGDTAVVVGKFELATNSVEDQTIYSLTLEQNSTAGDGNLTNLKIRRTDGTVLTNVLSSLVSDFGTFVFDPPFTILQGDKVTLEVIADIVGGAGDSIIMHYEESSDLFAVGSLYGYGVNGQLYGSQVSLPAETSTLPDTVSIDAGQFTIEIDGPVQQKYTRQTKDAVLAKVLITTGGEAVDIKDLFIAVQAQSSTGGGLQNLVGTSYDNVHEVLEDVELRNTVTGQTVSAVRLTTSTDFATGTTSVSTYQIYRFDDFVVKGKETWELRSDFINNGSGNHPKSGDRFRAHICGEPKKILDSSNALIANTTGCTFGGLISSSTSYQMDVEGLSTGDKVGDVRPRGTITGNFHRIANAELVLAVKNIGTSDTAVKNSKNVNLLRFEARAGEAKDILFTKSIFKVDSGSLLNGQNYALWVDTDGDSVVDTQLQNGVASQSSQITFDKLAGGGYLIPAEETVIFEVHADIAASLTNNDLLLMFDTGSSVTYIEAEQADDGSNLSGIKTNTTCSSTCDITVSITRSKLWILADAGSLFVTKDSVPVRSKQLLGGTLGDAILRLQFRAQDEDVDVTDIQFNSSGSSTNARSIDRLELYKEGETTPFTTATIGACGNDDVLAVNSTGGAGNTSTQAFCAQMDSRQLVVKQGQNLKVIVRPRIKTDDQGATSNELIQLFLTKHRVSDNTTGSGAVRARGARSSNDLSANDAGATANGEVFIGVDSAATNLDIVGAINRTALSKVVSITDANPDSASASPSVPVGQTPFGQFKFTAATNANTLNGLNKFVLSGVIFNINATNVTMTPSLFKLYNKNDASTKYTCVSRYSGDGTGIGNSGTASGSFLVDCRGATNTAISSVDTKVNSGDSVTFVLEGNVINAKVSSSANSTLQAAIQDFSALSNTTFAYNTSHIEWVDQDTANTLFYWIEYPETVVKSTSYKS